MINISGTIERINFVTVHGFGMFSSRASETASDAVKQPWRYLRYLIEIALLHSQ